MKVVKTKTIGYCHGVACTLEKAQQCLDRAHEENRPAYSIGTLIHNADVVKKFSDKGLKVINDCNVPGGIALVRAHGLADDVKKQFEEKGFDLIDATCINIQHTKDVIRKASSQGRTIVILGVKGHAETLCLIGTDNVSEYLVSSEEDLDKLFTNVSEDSKITLVCQTTFPQTLYDKLVCKISAHYPDCVIGSRLCPDCIKRKKEALQLAATTDAIIVVGGKNSENTKDLAMYIAQNGKPVFRIENEKDFNDELDAKLLGFKSIGVCSGTSTPMDIIDGVCRHLAALER